MPLPALLDSPPEDCLINTSHPDQGIDDGSEYGSFSESHAKQQGHKIHMSYADSAPVKGPNDDEYSSQNI